jgi:hypothetical protein
VEIKVKVKQSRYRPGVAQRVPGSPTRKETSYSDQTSRDE